MPDRMTVAAPVAELSPDVTGPGGRLVSVKYPVSSWMALARTMPISIAPNAIQLRVAAVVQDAGIGDALELAELVRQVEESRRSATPMTEITAEMKKPRLMAVIPLRSPLRGTTEKMPMTAVIMPMAGMNSGRTRP